MGQEGQVVGRHNGGDSAASGSDSAWADEWFDEGDPNHPDFDGLGAPAPITEMETWIILEYCDRGTLQSGIDKGFFRMQRTCRPPSEPNLAVVMATAIQLADALSYLHSRDIIHGGRSISAPTASAWLLWGLSHALSSPGCCAFAMRLSTLDGMRSILL